MSEHSSHSIYTPRVLALYDAWVLGISNRWIWKCPTSRLLAHYNQHVSANHLDVGVGTGYFLDRCRFPTTTPCITLLDINPHALARAARRIARYQPHVVKADLQGSLELDEAQFDSIGLNYVLHCLPGTMPQKAAVVQKLVAHLRPGGVLFGATLLAAEAIASRPARRLMAYYQARKIFANEADDLHALREGLSSVLAEVRIEQVGCAALFVGYHRH